MDDSESIKNTDNNPDNNPPPVKKRFIPVIVNGRQYSQSHSYRLRQKERDKKAEECHIRARRIDDFFLQIEQFSQFLTQNNHIELSCSSNANTSPTPSSSSTLGSYNEIPPYECESFDTATPTDDYLTEQDPLPAFAPVIQNDNTSSDTDTEFENNNADDLVQNESQAEWEKVECEKEIEKRRFFTRLHSIFVKDGISLKAQGELLQFMKDLPEDVRVNLPRDGRTLRPPSIAFTRRKLPPGELTYLGIENILNYTDNTLFDVKSNVINLDCNMDGVPLTNTASGKKFWPILGSIDDYPVFLIAAYEGHSQPACANDYIRDFVTEVIKLTKGGCTVHSRVYRFRLRSLICDSPATCFITGVKNHGGYSACRRCKTQGESIEVGGKNSAGRPKKSIRYPQIDDECRTHEEFVEYAQITADCHEEQNGRKEEDRARNQKKESVQLQYHTHPTILVQIPGFDCVRDCVLDWMHLVLSGVFKTMLERWTGNSLTDKSKYKLPKDGLILISRRLINARAYCPSEFARQPDSLDYLCSFKATQFRQLLLYIGVVVLRGIVSDAQVQHFYLLVVAMRYMCRKLPSYAPDQRREMVRNVANNCRKLLRTFFIRGMQLYSVNFALYNAHHIVHIPDDYERFEVPLDSISSFRYENANGHIKRLITGHFQPLTQLQNKVSSMIHTKLYTRSEKNRVVNSVEEYYEIPQLCHLMSDEDSDSSNIMENDEIEVGRSLSADNVRFERFKEMRFRNFKLRTDNTRDCHAFMSSQNGETNYIRLQKILRDLDSGEIYLVGYKFQRKRPLFSLTDSGFPSTTSRNAGIVVCNQLADRLSTFSLSELNEKCFALPLDLVGPQINEWVFIRYLH